MQFPSTALTSLPMSSWNYRGEGNSNIVFSIRQEKIILRFHKKPCANPKVLIDEEEEERVSREIFFIHFLIENFFGIPYVQLPCFTRLDESLISDLEARFSAKRPDYRKDKGIASGWVTIYPDYTFIPPLSLPKQPVNGPAIAKSPTYCVEIKPKQAWIHPDDRRDKCTFCMHQRLKVLKKGLKRKSAYCPLDLFSGYYERMMNSIKALLETPQNNLKIFLNGEIVFSDCKEDYLKVLLDWLSPEKTISREVVVERFALLLCDALRMEMSSSRFLPIRSSQRGKRLKTPMVEHNGHPSVSGCDWGRCQLPPYCILNRIYEVQRLQSVSFSEVYDLCNNAATVETNYSYIRRLDPYEPLDELSAYLLSATAKDCSILLAFQKISSTDMVRSTRNLIKDNNGTTYVMNIGVTDLDPKPLSCIEKHRIRDMNFLLNGTHE